MRAGLARARLNSRRRRSHLPLSGAALLVLATDDTVLVTLTKDFDAEKADDGTLRFTISEAAISTADMAASPDVAFRRKTGAPLVRFGNGNRVQPHLTNDGLWTLDAYAPIGTYTEVAP